MKTIFMIFFGALAFGLSAQDKNDFKAELIQEPKEEEVRDYGHYFQEADDEVEFMYTGMFVFYKSFVSSQDGSNCSFTPSCSEYAIQCIRKFGKVKGSVKFFDRYMRCNSLSNDFYKKDAEKKKLIDEVGDF